MSDCERVLSDNRRLHRWDGENEAVVMRSEIE
jgi:hypothetical protein